MPAISTLRGCRNLVRGGVLLALSLLALLTPGCASAEWSSNFPDPSGNPTRWQFVFDYANILDEDAERRIQEASTVFLERNQVAVVVMTCEFNQEGPDVLGRFPLLYRSRSADASYPVAAIEYTRDLDVDMAFVNQTPDLDAYARSNQVRRSPVYEPAEEIEEMHAQALEDLQGALDRYTLHGRILSSWVPLVVGVPWLTSLLVGLLFLVLRVFDGRPCFALELVAELLMGTALFVSVLVLVAFVGGRPEILFFAQFAALPLAAVIGLGLFSWPLNRWRPLPLAFLAAGALVLFGLLSYVQWSRTWTVRDWILVSSACTLLAFAGFASIPRLLMALLGDESPGLVGSLTPQLAQVDRLESVLLGKPDPLPPGSRKCFEPPGRLVFESSLGHAVWLLGWLPLRLALRLVPGLLDRSAERFKSLALVRLLLLERQVREAREHLLGGRLHEARRHLANALLELEALGPCRSQLVNYWSLRIYEVQGQVFRRMGEPREAAIAQRSYLEAARRWSHAEHVLAATQLGEQLSALGDWERAEGAYREALDEIERLMRGLDIQEGSQRPLWVLGRWLLRAPREQAGLLGAAVDALDLANLLRDLPNRRAAVLLGLGRCLQARASMEEDADVGRDLAGEAATLRDEAAFVLPTFLRNSHGEEAVAQGEVDAASSPGRRVETRERLLSHLRHLHEHQRSRPSSPWALRHLARVLLKLRRPRSSVALYRRLLGSPRPTLVVPDLPFASLAFHLAGEAREARALARAALSFEPWNLLALGILDEVDGGGPAGKDLAAALVRLDPLASEQAWQRLAGEPIATEDYMLQAVPGAGVEPWIQRSLVRRRRLLPLWRGPLGDAFLRSETHGRAALDLARSTRPGARRAERLRYALACFRAAGSRTGVAEVLLAFCDLGRREGRGLAALRIAELALAFSREAGDLELERRCHLEAACCQRGLGRVPEARRHLDAALDLVETIRLRIPGSDARSMFFGTAMELYAEQVSACLDGGQALEALAYVERSKARGLLELLGSHRIKVRQAADRELLERDEALQREILTLEYLILELSREVLSTERGSTGRHRSSPRALLPKARGQLAEARSRLEMVRAELAVLKRRIREDSGQWAALRAVPAVALNEAAVREDLARQLREVAGSARTVAVEYFVAEECTWIFVIPLWDFSPEQTRVRRSDIPERRFREHYRPEFLDTLARAGGRPHLLEEMHRDLVGPIQADLDELQPDTLLFVPHSHLHGLPLHAMCGRRGDGTWRYLVEDYACLTLPSLTTAPFLHAGEARAEGAMVLGNPQPPGDLAFSEREAVQVAELLGVEPLVRGQATESHLLNHCGDKRVLHLACHGQFVPGDALQSGLLLADSPLQVDEVMDLELRADLVTLSACSSGVSRITAGDELVGMTRAWLYAGASSVLATLWNVEDRATAEIATSFYRAWLLEGMPKVRALQHAQVQWLRARRKAVAEATGEPCPERRWPWRKDWDPHLWAPFVLVGAGR